MSALNATLSDMKAITSLCMTRSTSLNHSRLRQLLHQHGTNLNYKNLKFPILNWYDHRWQQWIYMIPLPFSFQLNVNNFTQNLFLHCHHNLHYHHHHHHGHLFLISPHIKLKTYISIHMLINIFTNDSDEREWI